MKRKAPETSADLLDFLAEAFDAVPPEGVAEAEDQLRSAGLDPEAVGEHLAGVAKDALAKSPFHWRTRAAGERRAALDSLQAVRRRYRTRAEMETRLAAILTSESQEQARAAFHKVQGKASDDDLASLLAQLEFLGSSDDEGKG